MKTIWNRTEREELATRLSKVQAGSTPMWGRMSAPQMVAHLADALRMAVGEVPCAAKMSPLRYPPFKQLVVYVLPFPKGVPTAPELLARAPAEWTTEVTELEGLVERIGTRGPAGPFADHPAFGKLSGRAWGALMYKHMDHHLRQFRA
jgi:hypothetical protein